MAVHLRASSYRAMPWKNGLGEATEIARSPAFGDFHWRISIAEVSVDGPFSAFPGFDRVILALDGAGMILRHLEPGAEATIDPLDPYAFSGDWSTECTLRGGPFRDFNVITCRSSWMADVSVASWPLPQPFLLTADVTFLYCISGSFVMASAEVTAGDSLRLDRMQEPTTALEIERAEAMVIRVNLSQVP
jgi:environmental stress-induced protein Ves